MLTKEWINELEEIIDKEKFVQWADIKNEPNIAKFYSKVIKARFPIKASRQHEMERLMEKSRESFGYIVLATLLTSKKYGKNFNIVFTTNFDNLIAESIYRHTNQKVRVIGHDSLMSYVNPNSEKPQIVKLHGDVEFYPKNTEEETLELNDEALEIVKHVLTNCGLIFLGYGGNDQSIINSLNQIGPNSIPNGIFWIRKNLPDSKFKDWLNERNGSFWIKHSNFDEVMMYFLDYFDIQRLGKDRCMDIENDFLQSLEKIKKTNYNV